jgi:hypothetical protein
MDAALETFALSFSLITGPGGIVLIAALIVAGIMEVERNERKRFRQSLLGQYEQESK